MKRGSILSVWCMIAGVILFGAGCAAPSVPMTACDRSPDEALKVFSSVWFNGTGGFHYGLLGGFNTAYETSGRLLLFKDSMEFRNSDNTGFEMRYIQNVSLICLKMTAFDKNKWVAVEYGQPPQQRTVYFADGSALGWGGATGGTAAMFNVIKASYPMPAKIVNK